MNIFRNVFPEIEDANRANKFVKRGTWSGLFLSAVLGINMFEAHFDDYSYYEMVIAKSLYALCFIIPLLLSLGLIKTKNYIYAIFIIIWMFFITPSPDHYFSARDWNFLILVVLQILILINTIRGCRYLKKNSI